VVTATPEQIVDDAELAARLRDGDTTAFATLITTHSPALRRVARSYVPSAEVADEVVQETWLAVIEGIERFEGRSSIKTWVFRILLNIARKRGGRERRSVAVGVASAAEDGGSSLGLDRFLPLEHPESPGRWRSFPQRWERRPEDEVMGRETMGVVAGAIAELSPTQREVMTLRDVEGWSGGEVCQTLSISEGNQRVLLHRARMHVRAALDRHFDDQLSA
jgi:RNA polymerase sigma-70 factor (ECF subfamily)